MSDGSRPPGFLFLVERGSGGDGGAGRALSALARRLTLLGTAPRVVEVEAGRGAAPRGQAGSRVVAFFPAAGADLYYPHGGCWKAWEIQNRACAEPALYRWYQRVRVRLSPKQRRAARREERLLACAHPPTVIAISRWVARAFARHHGLPEDRMQLLYNGVDAEAFRPDPDARDAARRRLGWERSFVCLFAAHNFRLKGLATFVRATALVKDPAVRWAAVGKGDPGPYRRLARRLGCADRLDFLGSAGDLAALYQGADLLVQPTFYDPCSLTSLEALACGLPVLTSAFNGAGEIVEDLGGGRVVADPADARGFAQAVDEIRVAASARLRGAARAAAERHTEESWARRFLSIAGSSVAGRPA